MYIIFNTFDISMLLTTTQYIKAVSSVVAKYYCLVEIFLFIWQFKYLPNKEGISGFTTDVRVLFDHHFSPVPKRAIYSELYIIYFVDRWLFLVVRTIYNRPSMISKTYSLELKTIYYYYYYWSYGRFKRKTIS